MYQEGPIPSVVGLQASRKACFAPLKFALLNVIRREFLAEIGGDSGQVASSVCSYKVRKDVDQVGLTKKVPVPQ